jgi:hypothetical protein
MSKRVTGPLIGMSLDMLVDEDEDGDLIFFWGALGRSTGHYRKVCDLGVGRWRANRKVCLALYCGSDWCGRL